MWDPHAWFRDPDDPDSDVCDPDEVHDAMRERELFDGV